MARSLIDLDILFSQDPITVCYSLSVSRTNHLSAEANKMVSWEKDSKRLIVQKPEKSSEKSNIEFAFNFAKAISEGLLWQHTDLIEGMSRLIQSGCAYKFDAGAMESLLKMENLRVFKEDDDFLASAFPSSLTLRYKTGHESGISFSPSTRS